MKDLISQAVHLYSLLMDDLSELSGVSLTRDLETINDRVQHEGLPFLTRTLPRFGNKFFQSLNLGSLQPLSTSRCKGALPKLFSGLTSRVFDAASGILLKDPCYVSAYCIRQSCYLLYKMEMPVTEAMATSAVKKLLECDTSLDGSVILDPLDKVLLLAESLISDVLGPFSWEATSPRHGPGASAHKIDKPWQKWFFWDDGSEVLPDEYFTTPGLEPDAVCGSAYDLATRLGLTTHTVRDMFTSKMSLVPKNSEGGRGISGEAVRLMWAQLGIDSLMRERISVSPLTRHTINFDDQSVNAKLALSGSFTGKWATLDLSEASNRKSLKLDRRLFPVEWMRAMERVRSTHMQLLSGERHELSMTSPMGNGYTFSSQTILFWALSAAAIAVSMEETYISEDDLRWACQNTFVYGDDIIVPQEYACKVMSSLERYGFRINRDKSYWTGPFRESCGIDAFLGADITPLKIKTPPRCKELVSKKKNVDATFVAAWWDQSRDWQHLLPRVSAWMKSEVYRELGFKPTYPEGWQGCIGEPIPYERAHGRPVRAEQRGTKRFQKVIRGPVVRVDVRNDEVDVCIEAPAFALLDTKPPSAGKLVKVVRVVPVTLIAPEDEFPEELQYLRCLQVTAGRREVNPGSWRAFTLRYSVKVVIRREWLS